MTYCPINKIGYDERKPTLHHVFITCICTTSSKNVPLGHMRIAKTLIRLRACAQSDQGLRYPLTGLFGTVQKTTCSKIPEYTKCRTSLAVPDLYFSTVPQGHLSHDMPAI